MENYLKIILNRDVNITNNFCLEIQYLKICLVIILKYFKIYERAYVETFLKGWH